MKYYTVYILISIVAFLTAADKQITIYNQGWAFVEEKRQLEFERKGLVDFLLEGLPPQTDPGSININSQKVNLLTKEFVHRPINTNSLLDANVGGELELVKYGENGDIVFSTMAKLLSNQGSPIFEIDGKIVVNPPYNYLFTEIPDHLTETPQLVCSGTAKSKSANFELNYLTQGISWTCNYALTINKSNVGNVESWFKIQNSNDLEFEDVDVTLISGDINFRHQSRQPVPRNMMTKAAFAMDAMEVRAEEPFSVGNTEDHVLFILPELSDIPANGSKQFRYVHETGFPIERTYHVVHNLGYGGRGTSNEPVPVNVKFSFDSEEIGEYNHPGGTVRVYEETGNGKIFIGSDNLKIVQKGEKFKINTGRSNDITAEFSIDSYDLDRRSSTHDVSAIFKNAKSKPVVVEWKETIHGDWSIKDHSIKYEKVDAATVKFMVEIAAESVKTVTFSVKTVRK